MSLSKSRIKKILKLVWGQMGLKHLIKPLAFVDDQGCFKPSVTKFLIFRLANLIFDVYEVNKEAAHLASHPCACVTYGDPFLQGIDLSYGIDSISDSMVLVDHCPIHGVLFTKSLQMEALLDEVWGMYCEAPPSGGGWYVDPVTRQLDPLVVGAAVKMALRKVSRRNSQIRAKRRQCEYNAGFGRWLNLRLVCVSFHQTLHILFPQAVKLSASAVRI